MRFTVISSLLLALGLVCGCAARRPMFVDPASITGVRFSKPCRAISDSLAICNDVMLTFSVASIKPVPEHNQVPRHYFQGFEVRK